MATCSEDTPRSSNAAEEIDPCLREDHASTILNGEVMLQKQAKTLTLTTKGVKLEGSGKSGDSSIIELDTPWHEVINAETSGEGNDSSFSIHYMEHQKDKKLRLKTLVLTCKNIDARKWLDVVQAQCQQIETRPKNLFVLINPIGGGSSGRKIYKSKVAPLFKLAGCTTTVKETEKSKHALEIGETQDFTGYDGVIAVGGDGLFQELFQGYFIQLQKTEGVNINDVDENFAKPKIPFCLIPAGTSNGMVGYTNDGVRDVETSVLRVLRGETHPINLLTVHEPGKFIGICALGVAMGFMVDVMKRTDELRWMRKARYAYAILSSLIKKKRQFSLHLEYLKDIDVPHEELHHDVSSIDYKGGWTIYDSEGKPFNQAFYSTLTIEDLEECSVINPYCPASDLIADFGSTFMEFFKFSQVFSGKKLRDHLPNIDILSNIKGVRLKVVRDPNETDENVSSKRARERELEKYLYLDGEIVKMDGLEIEARLHSGFVQMFGCWPSALKAKSAK